MNKYFINLTLQFDKEIEAIYNYIFFSLSAPQTANKLYFKIKKSIFNLNLFPERYPRILISKFPEHNLRKMIINNYIIIYQVDNIKHQVYILHIFHCSQDYLKYL